MWGHPGKKLLFMGCEFAPWSEWNADASLPWHLLDSHAPHAGMQRLVRDLNRVLRSTAGTARAGRVERGLRWISHDDAEHSVLVFERRALATAARGGGVQLHPGGARGLAHRRTRGRHWRELINTDDRCMGARASPTARCQRAVPWQGEAQSIVLRLPPLAW
jgi:1,4-alpha-glucan branching enzyme